MDESSSSPAADLSAGIDEGDPSALEETSTEYLGRWNRLVSTTNWEKGRIISEWRRSLMEAGASSQAYSDETWSQRVGSVSSQHVGRLRRAWDQFGPVYPEYKGLFWSHFQAALDWHDAEMWLEGAVQNGWSVAQMRAKRWETMGSPADEEPRPGDVVAAEFDEDVGPAVDTSDPAEIGESLGVVQDAYPEEDRPDDRAAPGDATADDDFPLVDEEPAAERVSPFAELPALPDDLTDALEAFKLALLNHKLGGWREVSREHVLEALEGLKQLALAPTEG